MKRYIFDVLIIAAGCLAIAVGLNSFLVPLRLSSGGIGTLGTVLWHLAKIPISVTNLALNAALFLLGYRLLGKGATVKTAAGIIFLSLFLYIAEFLPRFDGDIIICAVCGGVLIGIGVGLVVRRDGSTGGSDFAAIMLRRRAPHISVPGLILAIDLVIIILSGLVFKSFSVTFYSLLSLFISSRTADAVINIGVFAKTLLIVSNEPEKIEEVILTKLGRGVTEICAVGAFTGEPKKMLMCVVSPKESPQIIRAAHSVDKNAFIVITDAKEVLGEGFSA